MPRSRQLTLASLASLALLASAPPARAQSLEARAQQFLEALRAEWDAPAISAAVAVNGRIAFAEGVGTANVETGEPATGETVYRIA